MENWSSGTIILMIVVFLAISWALGELFPGDDHTLKGILITLLGVFGSMIFIVWFSSKD